MFKSARRVLAALSARMEVRLERSRRRYRAQQRSRQLTGSLECLEDRRLLSVLTVGTANDVVNNEDGVLSLREAILIANDSTGTTLFDGVSSTDVAGSSLRGAATRQPAERAPTTI